MFDLWRAFWGQNEGYDIEAVGAGVDVVGGEEVAGGFDQAGSFGVGYGGFGGCEIFAGAGFNLDEYEGSVGVDHNEVNFAGFAGEISCESLQAAADEIFFAAFLAPFAQKGTVEQESFSQGPEG